MQPKAARLSNRKGSKSREANEGEVPKKPRGRRIQMYEVSYFFFGREARALFAGLKVWVWVFVEIREDE
jgi:hypothetical protein